MLLSDTYTTAVVVVVVVSVLLVLLVLLVTSVSASNQSLTRWLHSVYRNDVVFSIPVTTICAGSELFEVRSVTVSQIPAAGGCLRATPPPPHTTQSPSASALSTPDWSGPARVQVGWG